MIGVCPLLVHSSVEQSHEFKKPLPLSFRSNTQRHIFIYVLHVSWSFTKISLETFNFYRSLPDPFRFISRSLPISQALKLRVSFIEFFSQQFNLHHHITQLISQLCASFLSFFLTITYVPLSFSKSFLNSV